METETCVYWSHAKRGLFVIIWVTQEYLGLCEQRKTFRKYDDSLMSNTDFQGDKRNESGNSPLALSIGILNG